MGQISLPRVNRLNNSMFWESAIFFEKNHFDSLKFYIFYKYFCKNFFSYSTYTIVKNWYGVNNKFYKKDINTFFFSNLIISEKLEFTCLKTYLYQINSKPYILFIYLNNFRLQKIPKPDTQKIRAINITKTFLYL